MRHLERTVGEQGADGDLTEWAEIAPVVAKQQRTRRRFLLAGIAATLGLATTYAAPPALKKSEAWLAQQLDAAFQRGMQAGIDAGTKAGRQALLSELLELEGISLDAAIAAASLGGIAFKVFVLPLTELLATLGIVTLFPFITTVQTAARWLGLVGFDTTNLRYIGAVLSSWQQNLALLPEGFLQAREHDMSSAITFLNALEHKLAAERPKQS